MRTKICLALAAILMLSVGASGQQYRYGNRYREAVPDRDDARYHERGFQNGYRHGFDGWGYNASLPRGPFFSADRGDRRAYERGYKNGYREGRQERRRYYRH